MKRYIAFYGGTDLSPEVARFVSLLARAVLRTPDVVLVTGGFDHFRDAPGRTSVDRAAADGAKAYLRETGEPVEARLETWLPASEKDRQRVERFREGRVTVLHGGSAQARRFKLVRQVDALVTFKGKVNTAMVLDMAFAIERPALPLPFTGGDSLAYWKEHRDQVVEWFGIPEELARRLEKTVPRRLSPERAQALANEVAGVLLGGIARRCLVLMQYGEEPDRFYREVVAPALLAEGFEPVRIDQDPDPGNILQLFLDRLDDCDAVVADVTEINPNVMYELGQAHARGVSPLLIARHGTPRALAKRLPLYLRQHKVEASAATSETGRRRALVRRIRLYLRDLRGV
jgi:hypothetical protein